MHLIFMGYPIRLGMTFCVSGMALLSELHVIHLLEEFPCFKRVVCSELVDTHLEHILHIHFLVYGPGVYAHIVAACHLVPFLVEVEGVVVEVDAVDLLCCKLVWVMVRSEVLYCEFRKLLSEDLSHMETE